VQELHDQYNEFVTGLALMAESYGVFVRKLKQAFVFLAHAPKCHLVPYQVPLVRQIIAVDVTLFGPTVLGKF